MVVMIAGLAVFFAAHFFSALGRGARARLVARLGEGPYKGLYSIVSAVGLGLVIWGWRSAEPSLIYAPPTWTRHVAFLLVLVAFVLIAAAYLPAGRIAAAVKHPMLASVKIWAFAHLLANGEVRSVFLFGSFLLFAVVDRIAVKRRGDAGRPAGRLTNDALAIGVGFAAYAAVLFHLHRHIAGVGLVS